MAQDVADLTVEVVKLHGAIPANVAAYARSQVRAVAAHAHQPVLSARVKLGWAADPAVARPAVAQVNLDVSGHPVRAQVAAQNMREAIDLVRDRLARRLERMGHGWESRRGRTAPGSLGQRVELDEARPVRRWLPPDQREIVRHKSYALPLSSAADAAFWMDAMDYEFSLFVDVETGQDAVLYRTGPHMFRMAATGPLAESVSDWLTVSPHPAPRLSITDAVKKLDLTGRPFLFFVDTERGRANVLYHRVDGNYGLITPAT